MTNLITTLSNENSKIATKNCHKSINIHTQILPQIETSMLRIIIEEGHY